MKKATTVSLENTKFKLLLRSRKFLLLAIGLGLLGLGLIILVIVPQVQAILDINSDIGKEEKLLLSLRQKQITLEQIETEVVYQADNQITQTLPSQKPLLEFMNTLDEKAVDAGVLITEVSLNPGLISTQSADLNTGSQSRTEARGGRQATPQVSTQDYDTLDVSLVVEAQLPELNAFFRGVEESAPVANIKSITLTEQTQERVDIQDTDLDLVERLQETDFRAELIVTTYFFTQTLDTTVERPLPEVGASEIATLEELKTFDFPAFSRRSELRASEVIDLFGLDELNAELNQQGASQI